METTRYPLSWPMNWKRTPSGRQTRAKFGKASTVYHGDYHSTSKGDLTVPQALQRLKIELHRLGARAVLISSNVELNSYGEPRGGRRNPDDVGVAVYFELGKKDRVLACDRFDRVPDNMAAVAAHISALRAIERYGVGTLDQAFAGYDALPAPNADNRPHWRTFMSFAPTDVVTPEIVRRRYFSLAKELHPDQGGHHDLMAALNAARDAALQEIAA
jgi:hypothetical protein